VTVTAYLIVHQGGQRRDDVLLEDDPLTLDFEGGWAIFRDGQGVCLAIPTALGAQIQRVDADQEPAPEKG
jgi:hypothetical protein